MSFWVWCVATFVVGGALIAWKAGGWLVLLPLSVMVESIPILGATRPPRISGSMAERLSRSLPWTTYKARWSILERGAEVGRDSGLIAFESGLLRFEGEDGEFAIPPSWLVEAANVRMAGCFESFGAVRGELCLCDGRTLRVTPYKKPGDTADDSVRKHFEDALEAWERSGDFDDELATLPPRGLHPLARYAVSDRWGRIGVGILAFAVLACISVDCSLSAPGLIAGIVIQIYVWGLSLLVLVAMRSTLSSLRAIQSVHSSHRRDAPLSETDVAHG